ncbi:MAG: cytochrome c [Bacteroidales bacterium]|nr:cytochrome c [Bacteroidales bacterium]
MKVKSIFLFLMSVSALVMMSFGFPQEQKKPGPWEIPAEYKAKENTYKDDASIEKLGKALYSKHCRACHGNTGEGDGSKSRNLETWPGDFSDGTIQAYTDGELYYMSIIGRDEMPNFESKITDDEARWAVVNYIRTFSK